MIRMRLAERAEPCWYCKEPIAVDDSVYLMVYGRYGCEACRLNPELMARLHPASKRTAPGYLVKCPKCSADPGELCRSTGDKVRALHPGRKLLAAR
jgi:hypothetical protein